MSETSEKARAAAKSKLERLTSADPHQKVDASDWTPPEAMENQAKTGMRPLSRSKYKKGGRVQGETAKVHAGRKPRARGGGVVDDLVNVDMKKANELRDGVKHDGGFARGGRSGKMMGGPMVGLQRPGMAGAAAPANGMAVGQRPGVRPMMRKAGGKVHSDAAEDVKLIRKELKSHGEDCRCAKCHGGAAKATGGALTGGTRPTGGRMPRKGGGRTHAKKGTTVNVIIASGSKPAMPPPGPGMPPPGAGPVGLHQAPPPAMAAAAAPPMGPPAGGAPPMMRKRGGRTGYPIESGAGGGLGRLEKVTAYG